MTEFLATHYLWLKALHVISVIFWMAGMAYLPRLFVYHAEAEVGSDKSETFKIMERRLLRGIINPAMVAAWILGGSLLLTPGLIDWSDGWIHVKLGLVILLSAYHGFLSRWRRAFERDEVPYSSRFFRIVNEIPPLFTIFIVILVIVRPF